MKLALFAIATILVASFSLYAQNEQVQTTQLERVQSGEGILRCEMRDGTRDIDPEKVIGRHDSTWLFVDKGYAKSCIVVVRNKLNGEVK